MKMNIQPKNYGTQQRHLEKEVYNNTGLPKEDRKISSKQTNPTSIRTRGTKTNKTHREEKEGNNHDQNRIR